MAITYAGFILPPASKLRLLLSSRLTMSCAVMISRLYHTDGSHQCFGILISACLFRHRIAQSAPIPRHRCRRANPCLHIRGPHNCLAVVPSPHQSGTSPADPTAPGARPWSWKGLLRIENMFRMAIHLLAIPPASCSAVRELLRSVPVQTVRPETGTRRPPQRLQASQTADSPGS